MKWLVAFFAGAVIGLVVPRQSPVARNEVEVNCPALPEIPKQVCEQEKTTLDSLVAHQKLLLMAYEETNKAKHELDGCRADIISAKSEADDWRRRLRDDNSCGGEYSAW